MKSERPQIQPRSKQAETSDSDHEASNKLGVRLSAEIGRLAAQPLKPGLYLVATPIGNLGDVTLRALSVLARADIVYCEDTRHSRTLFSHFGIGATLRPYHEHSSDEQRERALAELEEGKIVALISDAGTPLVSDPGFKLVREAVAAGHPVVAIPGASAVLSALSVAALPTDAFFFAGFLPPKEAARRSRIAELAAVPGSLVFYEAPSRTGATLADLAAVLGPRPAAVARELTKLHEEVQRAPLDALAESFARQEPKGEIVILVGPPVAGEVSDGAIEERLGEALAGMSVRDAAKTVAEVLGVPKARVYDLALKMKSGS
jgi:16S rRNA (cytidine1402-2'-O)-methyltransferase